MFTTCPLAHQMVKRGIGTIENEIYSSFIKESHTFNVIASISLRDFQDIYAELSTE